MVSEWVFGNLNNRQRKFLSRWSFEEKLFGMTYMVCAKLANCRFLSRGYALITEEQYTEKLKVNNIAHNDDEVSGSSTLASYLSSVTVTILLPSTSPLKISLVSPEVNFDTLADV